MNFNEVCKSASLQVASGFCNEDLRPAPKTFRLKRQGFRPNYLEQPTLTLTHGISTQWSHQCLAAVAIKDLSLTSVHRINRR